MPTTPSPATTRSHDARLPAGRQIVSSRFQVERLLKKRMTQPTAVAGRAKLCAPASDARASPWHHYRPAGARPCCLLCAGRRDVGAHDGEIGHQDQLAQPIIALPHRVPMAEAFWQRTFSTVKKCIASRKKLVPRGGIEYLA
jgi:hypothetical protein